VSGAPVRVAWVTNDLPPHSGGIQQFVASLLERTADAATLVLGPAAPRGRERDAAVTDAAGAWRTVRAPGPLLPTRATARWVADHLVRHAPDVVVIASLWPLGRIVPAIRRAVPVPVLGITHGAEAGLARGPARLLLRAVTREVTRTTVISGHTEAAIARALPGVSLTRLSPGVDPARFAAAQHRERAAALRSTWGVDPGAIVVGCVARLVPRKGQDVLLDVWPDVQRAHPDARFVIVGEGPARRRLERVASRTPGAEVVGPVSWADLPAAYAALDVFAMPVRTRFGGLDVEGLGISFLEAQAAGLPVIAGRSGGAPETVTDTRVGEVVDGRDPGAVRAAIERWLSDADGRRTAAQWGPQVAAAWSWDRIAAGFVGELVALVAP
jgi:phosphatidylinositol alpha-1,6-mannosyltransferase